MTRSISRTRPMTGSSFLSRASCGEVAAELVEHERAGLAGLLLRAAAAAAGGRPGRLLAALGALVAREQLDDLLADPGQVGAELHEHLGGDALALTDQAEEDVLGADVVVAELQRLPQRELEDLLGPGREGDVARRRRAALADDLLDLAAHGLEGDAEGLEGLGRDALALVDEAEQDVLGADVVVVEQAGFFLRQHDDPAGPVGESFEHRTAFECTDRGASVPRSTPRRLHGREPVGPPDVRERTHESRSLLGVAAASPLLALPAMEADLARVEAALRGAVQTDGRVPDRGGQPPHRGRRQAAAPGGGHGRRAAPGRTPSSDDVVQGGVSVELVHLGSLYHDDVMDEADTRRTRRERQRPVGQPAGHPRRRLPAGPGLGDRRLARHRGRRAAGRHHRPAVRGPDRRAAPDAFDAARTEADVPGVHRRQDGVAVLDRVPHRRHRRRAAPARRSTR